MNVWAEFVLVDDVEPVVVNIFSASKARAPIRVLVVGEGVPMGANVESTFLFPSAKARMRVRVR